MKTQSFSSVWDAICDTPAEAANMRVRASLMREIERVIKDAGWNQSEAARRLGVTQPRVSELVRGRVDLFSIDKLVVMLDAAGQRVDLVPHAA